MVIYIPSDLVFKSILKKKYNLVYQVPWWSKIIGIITFLIAPVLFQIFYVGKNSWNLSSRYFRVYEQSASLNTSVSKSHKNYLLGNYGKFSILVPSR